MSTTERSVMSAKDRDELVAVLKMRARTVKSAIDAQKAKRLAEAEAQLATVFSAEDERWSAALEEIETLTKAANERMRRAVVAHGFPATFAPTFHTSFWGRGENALPKRQAELRRVAEAQADAMAREAKLAVEVWETEARADLASRSLGSDEARAWLDKLPPLQQLMPPIDVAALALTQPTTKKVSAWDA